MDEIKPTYEELKEKLAKAEELIASLKSNWDNDSFSREKTEDNRSLSEHEFIEAYIESEENFRNSMDSCPLGIRVITAEGDLFYANQAILDICGYNTVEELKAVPKETLYTPDSFAAHLERKEKRRCAEYVPDEYEISIRRPDGEIRTLQVLRKEIIWGGERQYMAMYQDITGRLKLEADLRYHANLVQTISDAIISSDAQYRLLTWNKGAEEMYGWREEEVMGKTVMEITAPDFLNISQQEILSLLRTNGHWKGEAIHGRKNGERFNVLISISLIKDEKGKELGAVTVLKDISDRVKAEEALKESQERFFGAFHHSPSMNLIEDRNRRIIDVNNALCHVTGYSREEMIGKTPDEINAWYDEKQKQAVLNELQENGRVSNIEITLRMKNGNIRLFNVNLTLLSIKNEPYTFVSMIDITTRKETEAALSASEQRYRTSLDNMMEGCQIIDREWRYVYLNDSCIKQSRRTREELIGRRITDVYPEVLNTEMFAAMKRCMGQRISHRMEVEQQFPDGSAGWFDISMHPVPEGIFVLALDITERRKAEMAIHESEERFRRIFQAGPLGIALSNLGSRFTMANTRFCEMHGYSEKELVGMSFKDLSMPDDINKVTPKLEKLVKGEMPYFNVEKLNRKKNGDVFWASVTVTLVRDNEGNPQGFLAMVQDVTSRKEDEARINHLNTALRSIRNINQLITREKNRDRLIKGVCDNLVVSRSFHSAFIILLDDARQPVTWAGTNVGRGLDAMIEAVRKGELPRCLQKALSQKKVVVTSDPQQQCVGCPVLGDTQGIGSMVIKLEHEGAIFGVLYGSMWPSELINEEEISLFTEVAADITFALRDIDLVYSNELLQQDQLRAAKLESIGTLAGGIAHDFNNLLTGIMGNIGLAKSLVAPATNIYEMLDEAEKAAIRSRDLTQQLLTFARGGKPIKKITDISNIIRDSASFALRGSKIRLELFLPDDLWLVEADEGQMSQVIHNLVINADEAMPDGGILTISVKNLKIKKTDALPLAGGNYIQIDVTDTGIGIAPEHLQKIFEPYFTTKHQGSGLGLTSAYSIIKSHGGSLLAESNPGRGSAFHIYLPASRKTAGGEKKVAAEKSTRAGGNVLIMDDEEIIRKMLKNMLNFAGYEAESASNGEEALEKYKQAMDANNPFTAVIMDLTIPGGMGGKEAVKKLLEIDPKASVIVSSGYATDAIMSEYKKYGFSAVIAKPYSIKQLQETMAGLKIAKKK